MKNLVLTILSIVVFFATMAIISLNGTIDDLSEENELLFEYVDAHKKFMESSNNFATYTKHYDEVDRYKSDYYFYLQESEKRFDIIKDKVETKFY